MKSLAIGNASPKAEGSTSDGGNSFEMFCTDGASVTYLGHDEDNTNGGNPWKEDILPKNGKELHIARRGMRG